MTPDIEVSRRIAASPDAVFAALTDLRGVRGRMELVARRANGGAVYVDYAHTPDALATALAAMRAHTPGRLLVVFGAGGDRDPGKRGPMGEAVGRRADLALVTSDNPRSEDPAVIAAAVADGVRRAGTEPELVLDRSAAIARALEIAGPGDVVVIAGKGHEAEQIDRHGRRPFSDHEVAAAGQNEIGSKCNCSGDIEAASDPAIEDDLRSA